ncbi:hypothetical protein RI844_07155 [Thalassotalea fonticola]|uniref:protein-tyrosine-phosphatase n=1 Tax=Thalassotalea fonticola TaxID=3065649 RepID=A0ABZ0GUF9_9GAMM|nr:hypothetical protein RI844_07155 [Colwelliaceae bacterium S1-1]
MFNKILTVCIGNICRSPSAERILKAKLPTKAITSAGLGALVGHGVEEHAAQILAEHNYDDKEHQARQVSNQMIIDADLILVMEKKHQQSLMNKYPAASGKIMLLGKWNNEEEIPDPYKKSIDAFQQSFKQIEHNCQRWADKLA